MSTVYIYAVGYIPRQLRKKLPKSLHLLRINVLLCIGDLLDDQDDSHDWVELVNRGGLTRVNNTTFDMFLAIELELRQHVSQIQPGLDLEQIVTAFSENEDVITLWSLINID